MRRANPVYDYIATCHLADQEGIDEELAELYATVIIGVLEDHVKFLVFQLERGEETGMNHFQMYLSLKKKQRITTVAPLFVENFPFLEAPHLEERKGAPEDCYKYCTKDDTRLFGPWEIGKMRGNSGKRTDLDAPIAAIMEGKNLYEVLLIVSNI